jgi:hypothetical protein
MSDRNWERLGGGSGAVFAVLLLVGIIPGGVPPPFGTDSQGVVAYFTNHQAGLQVTFFAGNVLPTVLGTLFSSVLFVALWKVERSAQWGAVIGLVGAATVGAFAAALSIVWSILVYDAGHLGTSTSLASVLYDGTVEAGAASIFIEGLVAFGFGMALARLTPGWRRIGLAGVVIGLLNLAVGVAMFAAEFKTGAVPLLGIGTFVIWTVVVGIGLAVRGMGPSSDAQNPV